MGRKTFDSLNQKPLPDRFNVVVSHEYRLFPYVDQTRIALGIDEALHASETAPSRFKETFIIGGQSMYEQFASIVDRYLITVVDKQVANGDTFFRPELIGSIDDWVQETVRVGSGEDDGDEAPFEIISLTHKDSAARRAERSARVLNITRSAPLSRPRASGRSIARHVQNDKSMPAFI